ncbi:hypothetical protein [uncultured Thiocystis sp.]|jgi:adenine-specific DNA-methyltransferase|uniref:hypothetical protein n=1 Tax=uncultured Thiocystis sp. TaxID=1202134 RepID=UPI0025E0F0C7|nr:hypothetical protein [uncultured Thiocystis sp.]
MAHLEDKIADITDVDLRQTIAEEVAKLKKGTRFGLVFEDHQPEVLPIYDAHIKRGERVARKAGKLTETWRVLKVADEQALCEQEQDATVRETFSVGQLVVVRRIGDAIFPALTPLDAVSNDDSAAPHHILIGMALR